MDGLPSYFPFLVGLLTAGSLGWILGRGILHNRKQAVRDDTAIDLETARSKADDIAKMAAEISVAASRGMKNLDATHRLVGSRNQTTNRLIAMQLSEIDYSVDADYFVLTIKVVDQHNNSLQHISVTAFYDEMLIGWHNSGRTDYRGVVELKIPKSRYVREIYADGKKVHGGFYMSGDKEVLVVLRR